MNHWVIYYDCTFRASLNYKCFEAICAGKISALWYNAGTEFKHGDVVAVIQCVKKRKGTRYDHTAPLVPTGKIIISQVSVELDQPVLNYFSRNVGYELKTMPILILDPVEQN